MPTPAERQALLFVAAVAALGVGVRGCRAIRPPTVQMSDRAALASQMAAVDSAVSTGGARRPSSEAARAAKVTRSEVPTPPAVRVRPQARLPLAPVDVDRAGVVELDRLPGIGPALAARIVADREAHGPFGSMRALERVKGIGPALARKLEPHVTFSLPPRLSDTEVPPREGVVRP